MTLMTPPEAPTTGSTSPGERPPAVSVRLPAISRLRHRADFLRTARAARQGAPAFLLQARRRAEDEATGIRVGFTCSKKVGNAVARNRAKRRLREVARLVLPDAGRDGWDYVLIGQKDKTAERPFDKLLADLESALARVHGKAAR